MAARAIREGLVVDRVKVDGEAFDPEEPVAILARLAVLENVLEREPSVAGVVEDAVEKHANVPAMRVADQRREIIVGAEARVDALVVGRVVLVVRRRREHRREVQAADAEIGEPAEVLADARKVAAEERLHRRRLAPRSLPGRVVHLVAIRETVREHEIERSPGDPRRQREAVRRKVVRVEEMSGVMLAIGASFHETVFVEKPSHARGVRQLEEIPQTRGRHRKHGRPVVAHAIGALARERQRSLDTRRVFVREVAPDRRQVTRFGEEANIETVTGQRLHERRTSAVLNRGESQRASFMRPTLACPGLVV